MALSHLYSFTGKLRDVNMSKGGFPFAVAKFLPEAMSVFENEILSALPNKYKSRKQLINDIAIVHGNYFLFIRFAKGMDELPVFWQI